MDGAARFSLQITQNVVYACNRHTAGKKKQFVIKLTAFNYGDQTFELLSTQSIWLRIHRIHKTLQGSNHQLYLWYLGGHALLTWKLGVLRLLSFFLLWKTIGPCYFSPFAATYFRIMNELKARSWTGAKTPPEQPIAAGCARFKVESPEAPNRVSQN